MEVAELSEGPPEEEEEGRWPWQTLAESLLWSLENRITSIIDHLQKFSSLAANRNFFLFCPGTPDEGAASRGGQVANWVILVMIRPRAEHDHDYPVGEEGGKWARGREGETHQLGNRDHVHP